GGATVRGGGRPELVAAERGQHDPGGDAREREGRCGVEMLAAADRDQRRDRPFGGRDRRDEPDLAEPQPLVDEDEPADVAETGDGEPAGLAGIERGRRSRNG